MNLSMQLININSEIWSKKIMCGLVASILCDQIEIFSDPENNHDLQRISL